MLSYIFIQTILFSDLRIILKCKTRFSRQVSQLKQIQKNKNI